MIATKTKSLIALSRYESRIQREYSRCLKDTPEQPASTTSNPRPGPAEY
jgi:hypothetical protein